MKKLLSIFTVLALVLGFVPTAQAANLYADELVAYSFADLWNPANVLGEPDQLYTDFRDKDTYVKVDMGQGEEGYDGLKLFFQTLNYGATAVVTFYSADNVVLGSDNKIFSPGQTEWTAEYFGTEPFRFVKIASPEEEQWKLDAVQASAIATPVVDDEVVTPEEEPEPVETDEIAVDSLIKLATSDAVYLIGSDGKRHPFPNEVTFFSWGYDFEDVATVDAETMASYMMGGSVTIKPGTYLVKIQSVPKVYVVAPGRSLRWLKTEAIAAELFGAAWANEVVDVSDAFWPDYTEGAMIDEADDLEDWPVELRPF